MDDTIDRDPAPFKDRRKRLLVGGILLMLMGCGALLLGLGSAASVLMMQHLPETQQVSHLRPIQAIPGFLMYCGIGGVLLVLGFGSVLRRRWSRPLILIVSWGWLAMGFLTLFMAVAMVPVLQQSLPAEPGVGAVVYGCFGVTFGLFGIVVPAIFLVLYSPRDVAATLAALDPETRWTDRIPTPLLGLVLWLGLTAGAMVPSCLYALLPVGGTFVTGPIAVAVYLVAGGIFVAVAVGLARRSRLAWWTGLITTLVWGGWSAATVPRIDFDEVMRHIGMAQQPGVPDMGAMYHSPWFLGPMVLIWLGLVAYFLFARRYLR